MFTHKGLVGTVVAGVLAVVTSAIPASLANSDEGSPPVRTAIYRVEQPAGGPRLTTEPTPAAGESQPPETGVLRAALERWRGGGGGLPVTTAIYRVEKPAPGESPSAAQTSAANEPESTTGVKFDLVRWHGGGWGRGFGWGGGWGRGFGWGRFGGFGWGGRRFGWGYPGFGWGRFGGFGWGGRRFGWGGFGFYRPWFYRPFIYRPYLYGYPGYGYGYGGFGYGGYPIAWGGYGYPLYGGYW